MSQKHLIIAALMIVALGGLSLLGKWRLDQAAADLTSDDSSGRAAKSAIGNSTASTGNQPDRTGTANQKSSRRPLDKLRAKEAQGQLTSASGDDTETTSLSSEAQTTATDTETSFARRRSDKNTTLTVVVRIENEEAQPVPDAKVEPTATLSPTDPGREWQWPNATVTSSDANGEVTLPYPAVAGAEHEVGELILSVSHPDYLPGYRSRIVLNDAKKTIVLKKDREEKAEVRFKVVDDAGAPIPDAAVQASGLRTHESPGAGWGWREAPVTVATDTDGRAAVKYSKRLSSKDTVSKVMVNVVHPEFIDKSYEAEVAQAEHTVKLERGVAVVLAGYIGSESIRAKGLKVMQGGIAVSDAWRTLDEYRVINTKLPPGKHIFRVTHEAEGGKKYISKPLELEAKPEPQEISVELFGAMTLRGKLSANVPRPVMNGTVIVNPSSATKDTKQRWGDLYQPTPMPIQEDGTFSFDSMSAGPFELIALANGWRNAEGPPRGEHERRMSGIPQKYVMERDGQELEIPMVPTATLRAMVHLDSGQPVEGAQLSLWPNVFWNAGATLFVRQNYTATTDAAGIAIVPDLPVGHNGYRVSHPDLELDMETTSPRFGLSATLTAGEVTAVKVKMRPARAP